MGFGAEFYKHVAPNGAAESRKHGPASARGAACV